MAQRVRAGMVVAEPAHRWPMATSAAVTTIIIITAMLWYTADSVGGAIHIIILTTGIPVITTVRPITVPRRNLRTRLIRRPEFRTKN